VDRGASLHDSPDLLANRPYTRSNNWTILTGVSKHDSGTWHCADAVLDIDGSSQCLHSSSLYSMKILTVSKSCVDLPHLPGDRHWILQSIDLNRILAFLNPRYCWIRTALFLNHNSTLLVLVWEQSLRDRHHSCPCESMYSDLN
jgi:hypothetical protein